MSDSKVTEVIISTLTSLERAAASYWFGPSPPVWFSRRPNSDVYISPKPFPAFPIFTSATLVHAVAQPRNFGKLLLTHPSSSPAPIRLPSPLDWHVTHHQILLNVPLKYVSVPHTCLHPPVTDMVPVTIPPPSNSSHSHWTLGQKAKSRSRAHKQGPWPSCLGCLLSQRASALVLAEELFAKVSSLSPTLHYMTPSSCHTLSH